MQYFMLFLFHESIRMFCINVAFTSVCFIDELKNTGEKLKPLVQVKSYDTA